MNKAQKELRVKEVHYDITPGNWKDWRHFMPGVGWDKLESTHCLYEMQDNTQGVLGEANKVAFLKRMEPYGDDVKYEKVGAGLRGVTIHAFMVKVVDEEGNPTPARMELAKIIAELEDYPILDDDLFSEMETEEYHEYLKNEMDSLDAYLGDSDEDVYTLADRLSEDNGDYGRGILPDDEEIEYACRELGLLTEDE